MLNSRILNIQDSYINNILYLYILQYLQTYERVYSYMKKAIPATKHWSRKLVSITFLYPYFTFLSTWEKQMCGVCPGLGTKWSLTSSLLPINDLFFFCSCRGFPQQRDRGRSFRTCLKLGIGFSSALFLMKQAPSVFLNSRS